MHSSRHLLAALSLLAACAEPTPSTSAREPARPAPAPLAELPGATPSPDAPRLGPIAVPTGPVCAPELRLERAYVTEGEQARVTARCSSSARLDGLVTTLGPAGWRWAPASGVGTWQTGLADGGVHVVTLEVRAGPDAPVERASAQLSIADAFEAPANMPVDPARYEAEWGLPVLHLFPSAPLGESYVPTRAFYEGVAYEGAAKIRGATSSGYPKPPLLVKFDPVPLRLAGRPDKHHLVLISDFDDNSYARQRQVFGTWAAMAAWSGEARLVPQPFPLVVFLDGRYQGLYTAVDHVDDEFVAEHGLSRDGNLYKSVNHDANFRMTDAWGDPKGALEAGWEKKEGLPADDFSDLNALTTWASTVDDARFAAELDDWLPRTEWMDWLLLVHFHAADDSGGKNAYVYDDPRQPRRFRYAPWDFNHSLGQDWTTARVGSDAFNDFSWSNELFARFQRDPALAAELWARFAAMRAPGGPLSREAQLALLDGTYAGTEAPVRRDWARWGPTYLQYWSWRSDLTTPAEERAWVRRWLVERDAFLSLVHPRPP